MKENEPWEPREKPVFFIQIGRQEELRKHLELCKSLWGSDILYDSEGNLFYYTWRDMPEFGLPQSEQYINISKMHPSADISAPHTRYTDKESMIIHQVIKDGGSVEAAIRAMDHILTGIRGKEKPQIQAIKERASELFDVSSTNFSELTEEDFVNAREKTFQILKSVGFNPAKVYDAEKVRIAYWLPKGSFGKDSQNRRNYLIAVGALAASYRRAIVRQKSLNKITCKFVTMREALILEREFSREIIQSVICRLEPNALPSHVIFKKPDQKPQNVGPVLGLLRTSIFQLRQPHVKPYRTIGRQANKILNEIINLVNNNQRKEIVEKGLFNDIHNFLITGLDAYKNIYPEDES